MKPEALPGFATRITSVVEYRGNSLAQHEVIVNRHDESRHRRVWYTGCSKVICYEE
jgi:hypothetical protein